MSNTQNKKIITVFGATGRQGGGAVGYLTTNGTFHVRAVTRNPESEAAKALAKLGAEVVKADLDDKASVLAALKGAYGVFGVTDFWQPGVGPREEDQGKTLVDAAKEAGTQHFVWATLDHSEFKAAHLETKANVDDYLKASGVPRTSLYGSFFLENIGVGPFALKRQADGTLLWDIAPFVTDGVIPVISGADCGVIAGIAFTKPEKFVGKDIFAASAFTTPRKMGQEVSEFLGETVKVREFGMDELDGKKESEHEIWAMVRWFYTYGAKKRSVLDTLAILPKPKTFKEVLEQKGRDAILPE